MAKKIVPHSFNIVSLKFEGTGYLNDIFIQWSITHKKCQIIRKHVYSVIIKLINYISSLVPSLLRNK